MDTTLCPECGALAEVQWREVIESTDGPVEHAKISCVRRHWFLLPVAHLARGQAAVRGDRSVTARHGRPVIPQTDRQR